MAADKLNTRWKGLISRRHRQSATPTRGEADSTAARRDYPAMSHRARSLHERGLTPEQVLRECYGIDCPREFFVICESEPTRLSLPVDFTNQPWKLAVPLASGGPRPTPDSMDRSERRHTTGG